MSERGVDRSLSNRWKLTFRWSESDPFFFVFALPFKAETSASLWGGLRRDSSHRSHASGFSQFPDVALKKTFVDNISHTYDLSGRTKRCTFQYGKHCSFANTSDCIQGTNIEQNFRAIHHKISCNAVFRDARSAFSPPDRGHVRLQTGQRETRRYRGGPRLMNEIDRQTWQEMLLRHYAL